MDAKELADEFKPDFGSEDIIHTENYQFYTKLMIDGKRSKPFTAETLPPLAPSGDEASMETVVKVSRERFALPRAEVEDKIEKWFA